MARCLVGCLFLLAAAIPVAWAEVPAKAAPGKYWLFVGTYTGAKSKGIYRFAWDPSTGKLGDGQLAAETTNPTFLAIHPSGKFLYAVGEVSDFDGKKAGGVIAYALDPATGKLKLLNKQSSGGPGPCHIVTDKAGKHVLVANYGGGSASVLPIEANGSLGEATAFVQHKGTSVDKNRQEAPHAHSINLDAANRFAVVADLGLDQVVIYQFDKAKGNLTFNDPPFAEVAPGSGPRHFAFHPDGKHAYVINEMACTVTAFDYDAEKGALTKRQTITTVPDKVKSGYSTAEVVVHPSGKFLYGSNRGQNSIAIFTIDPKTGELTAAGHQGEGVKTPRNFAIDPTGKYLLVGNQDGDSVIVFEIDLKTGALRPTDQRVEVAGPVCLRFVAIPSGARGAP